MLILTISFETLASSCEVRAFSAYCLSLSASCLAASAAARAASAASTSIVSSVSSGNWVVCSMLSPFSIALRQPKLNLAVVTRVSFVSLCVVYICSSHSTMPGAKDSGKRSIVTVPPSIETLSSPLSCTDMPAEVEKTAVTEQFERSIAVPSSVRVTSSLLPVSPSTTSKGLIETGLLRSMVKENRFNRALPAMRSLLPPSPCARPAFCRRTRRAYRRSPDRDNRPRQGYTGAASGVCATPSCCS